ncbi:MAG: hypothetical protein HOG49_36595 [Candidatus Scalindua sp.]|jgi:hypothetical protein|nr:hypothetical protein [Candidatus Scalindua sp.]
MEEKISITLSANEKLAIEVALAELVNSGEWTEYLEEGETESVYDGMRSLNKKLKQ